MADEEGEKQLIDLLAPPQVKRVNDIWGSYVSPIYKETQRQPVKISKWSWNTYQAWVATWMRVNRVNEKNLMLFNL